MSLCYDFEKWTIVTFAIVASVLIIGLFSQVVKVQGQDAETKKLLEDAFGYHTYEECIKFWSTPESLDSLNKSDPTSIPDDMCKYYRK